MIGCRLFTFSVRVITFVWLTAIYLIACNDRLCDEDIHMDLQSLWCAILVGASSILTTAGRRWMALFTPQSWLWEVIKGQAVADARMLYRYIHIHSYTQNMYVYAISSTWLEDEFGSFLWDIAAVQGHGLWNGSKSGSFVRGALSDKDNTGAHCGSYQPIGGQIILDHWWPQRTEGMP